MMDRTAQAAVREHPPQSRERLAADLARPRFIEQSQAYLNDLYQWLRENNHHLRGRKALARFTQAHDA